MTNLHPTLPIVYVVIRTQKNDLSNQYIPRIFDTYIKAKEYVAGMIDASFSYTIISKNVD